MGVGVAAAAAASRYQAQGAWAPSERKRSQYPPTKPQPQPLKSNSSNVSFWLVLHVPPEKIPQQQHGRFYQTNVNDASAKLAEFEW